MRAPFVSIIIPTFNRADLIGETLESIRKQTYQNWECIIVDDGSQDGSIKIVKQFCEVDPRISIYERPADRLKGANACRNYGFEMSKGDFVNWFDSDDLMTIDFIERKLYNFAVNRNIDATISKLAFFVANRQSIVRKETRTMLTDDILNDFLQLKITWYLPDVMWRREFLNSKELFDETLLAGQDRNFFARMLLFEPRLSVIDEYLTLYRQHSDNITSKVNNIHHRSLKISHLYSTKKLINILIAQKKITDATKLHYFRALLHYLPYTIGNKRDTEVLIDILKQLSLRNFRTVLMWIKFAAGYIAFKLFGKGDALIR